MAKVVEGLIKLQIRGGAANPSPPVGPALGAKGVNIMELLSLFMAISHLILLLRLHRLQFSCWRCQN